MKPCGAASDLCYTGGMENPKSLPELLSQLNAELNWQDQDLADAAGVDKGHLSRVMTGSIKKPRTNLLQNILEAYRYAGLDVDMADLIAARDGEMLRSSFSVIPPRWRSLFQRIVALDHQRQEVVFRTLSWHC